MNKDNKPYSYPKEATPEMVGEMAKKFEEMRQMTGSDGRYDKPKPKKKVMEPIEIPEVLSVPRHVGLLHGKKIGGMLFNTKLLPESNRRPQTSVGLSQRFTQDKMREAQISKQLDQELANERNNSGEEKTKEEL